METTATGEEALPFTQLVEASIETVTCVRESDERCRLLVRGWLVYFMGPLQRIFLGIPGSPMVEARRYARQDIYEHFGNYDDALLSGFEIELPLLELPKPPIAIYARMLLMNNLSLVAMFEGPSEIPVFDKATGRSEPPLRLSETVPSSAQLTQTNDGLRRMEFAAFLAAGRELAFDRIERPKVSVLVPARANPCRLYSTLEALHAASRKQVEVIVLAGERSEACEPLLERVDGVTILRAESGAGADTLIPGAAEKARGDFLLLLNGDTVPTSSCLDAALRVFETQARVGVVTSRLVSPDGCAYEGGSILWQNAQMTYYGRGALATAPDLMFMRDAEFASGAFLLTPRRLFESFGGFDPALSTSGYATADYCIRLHDGGYRTVYEPAACAFVAPAEAAADSIGMDSPGAERAAFQKKHARHLAGRLPYDLQQTAAARHARLSEYRLLVVCTSEPMDRKLRGLLEALVAENCHVSLVSLWTIGDLENTLPPPKGVEIFEGCDPMFLRTLIESRPDYFTAVWIPHGQSIAALRELQHAAPKVFDQLRLLSDASVQAPEFSLSDGIEHDAIITDDYLPLAIRDKLRLIS